MPISWQEVIGHEVRNGEVVHVIGGHWRICGESFKDAKPPLIVDGDTIRRGKTMIARK